MNRLHVFLILTVIVWPLCLTWDVRDALGLRGGRINGLLRLHKRLALRSLTFAITSATCSWLIYLFYKRKETGGMSRGIGDLDFTRMDFTGVASRIGVLISIAALVISLGPLLSISYLERIRRVEFVDYEIGE